MIRCVILSCLFVVHAVPCPAAPPAMELKAEIFQKDMEARFLLDGQALCKLKHAGPGKDFIDYNMPDNAYMTGIYTATLSMKYAVTGDREDLEKARQSLRALHLLCNVSGEPGLLARAAWPKDRPSRDDGVWRDSPDGVHIWRGDVSTDQVDGVMFGFHFAFDLIADDAEKELIARDVSAMVDRITAHDLRIVDIDGKPTRWGKYFPSHVRLMEKMNALLWLQVCKVAAHVTGDAKYAELYRRYAVDEKYAEIAVDARRSFNPLFPGAVNHSDDVLLYLAYTPLLALEADPALRGLYEKSARRAWDGNGRFPGVAPEGNPFYAFAMAKHLGEDAGVDAGVNTLRWFPLHMKMNRSVIAEFEASHGFAHDPAPLSPEPEKDRVIPVDRRQKTWSAWVQNPYQARGDDAVDESMEFNGHDYLLGYWMGRHYGYVRAGE